MRQLPREVDPLVHNMSTEDPGDISYSAVGGGGGGEGGWGNRLGNCTRSVGSIQWVWSQHCGMLHVYTCCAVEKGCGLVVS